ncbi:hypothetical protein [Streptomyces sp. NRRL S-350]|uniref:hypothetical protein n=1 Tax=Streptomyces sp. NRRL S-350 TaxID=1463902 RepID=UPI000ADD3107|nr:hypothetical protein [Streptomyces sp. NRRL S-350]
MEKPLVIVQDECWELLTSGNAKNTLEAEPGHRGMSKEEILDGLVRQNRQGKPPLPFTS